jgi:hypothetical protein
MTASSGMFIFVAYCLQKYSYFQEKKTKTHFWIKFFALDFFVHFTAKSMWLNTEHFVVMHVL